jgi:Rrf2 family protein
LLVITTKSAYAVRALAELARRATGPVPIGDIAARRNIPPQFLESLFSTMRRGGILRSQRGVKGGYSLARPAEEITVLEVVELLEGDIGAGAADSGAIWTELVDDVRTRLGGLSIAEVAQREARDAGAAMYYI